MSKRTSRAYSLIELLVVLAVLAILGLAIVPLAEVASTRQREQELRTALREVRAALDGYKRAADAGRVPMNEGDSGYPPSLLVLAQGIDDVKSPGERLHFLRRVPRDPFAEPGLPAEQTWGLRSYSSSAERPLPGRDVYDVYSKSERIGLNGVPLREW